MITVEEKNKLYSNLEQFDKDGAGKGYEVGYKNLENFYNMKLGSSTDWSGWSRHGKTQLLKQLLINMSALHNWKHLIYMPDAGDSTETMAELIEKYTGKTFRDYIYFDGMKHKTKNRITKKEWDRAFTHLSHYFQIATKKDQGRITPVELWEYAIKHKDKTEWKTVTIDSWNYMKGAGGDNVWLSDTLAQRNVLAQESGLHFHTIIHPRTPTKEDEDKAPTEFNLKGGTEWLNHSKNLIIVNRENFKTERVDIFVRKSKPKGFGQIGNTYLNFDKMTSTYYEHQEGKLNSGKKLTTKEIDELYES